LPIEGLARVSAWRAHTIHLGLGSGHVIAIHAVEEMRRQLGVNVVAHKVH
jgi:hypothetical protein